MLEILFAKCSVGSTQTDGRMYPPEEDNAREVEERGDVIRYRHKAHNTFLRDNGAMEIQDVDGKVFFEKLGSDGRGVELKYANRKVYDD
jgi:hypothetical protein